MSIRAFIALDVPQLIQDSISKETARLQKSLGDKFIRWTPIQNIHLTLKFLGNIPVSHIDFLKQILIQTADSYSPFDVQIKDIASFPSPKLIRILWLSVFASASLTSIQTEVDGAVTKLGYEKEARAFSPHLTIARVKKDVHPNDMQKIREGLSNFQLGKIDPLRVDSIHLYQSDLKREGSLYTKLFSVKLT